MIILTTPHHTKTRHEHRLSLYCIHCRIHLLLYSHLPPPSCYYAVFGRITTLHRVTTKGDRIGGSSRHNKTLGRQLLLLSFRSNRISQHNSISSSFNFSSVGFSWPRCTVRVLTYAFGQRRVLHEVITHNLFLIRQKPST